MRNTTAMLLMLIVLLLAMVGRTADKPVTLEELREELDEVKLKANSISSRLEKSLQIHGFVSQGWMRSTDNNWLTETDDGSFDFNEIGLNIRTELMEDLHVSIQLFSRSLGDFSTDGVAIDYAYGDYSWCDWMGFRIGRVKTAMGLYGESRDIDAVRVPILLPQGVYDDKYRQFIVAVNGLSSYGNVGVGPLGRLDYQGWIGGVNIDADTGIKKFFENNGTFVVRDIETRYQEGLHLNWDTPVKGFRLIGSFARVHDMEIDQVTGPVFGPGAGLNAPASIDRLDVCTIGAEYTLGALILAGEYTTYRGKLHVELPALLGGPFDQSFYNEGYYTSATYQLTSKLSVGAYYSLTYENAQDKDGSNQPEKWYAWQKDLCLSTRYDINENWLIKAEIHFLNGVDMTFPVDNPDGFTEDWRLLAFKLTYSF